MKRVLVVLLMVMALSSVMARAKNEAAGDDYVFKIGFYLNALCQAPLYVAIDQGYFEEEGLKWDSINVGDTDVMNLIIAGQVDGTMGLMIGMIQPLANGLPVQIPMAIHTGCIKLLVRGDSPIKTLADLKGKKIGGASPVSSPLLLAKRVLASNGFKVDGENADFEYIYQSSADLPLLLARGGVDAIALVDPSAQIAIDNNGFRAIIDNATDDDLKDEYCCVAAMRSETVKAHSDATAKFLRALQKGGKFVQEHTEETVQILIKNEYVTIDPLVIAKLLKTYNWRASVSQAKSALERNAKDLQHLGILKADVDVNTLVKDVFVAVPGVPDSLF